MREIKFRGKRTDNSKHERKEFVYGSYLYINNYEYDWNGNRSNNKKEAHFIIGEDDRNIIVDKETVGQYTGLKDKNETEIYEDDIVEIDNEIIAQVIWEEDYASFYLYTNEENSINDFETGEKPIYDYIENLEVIGNIHDNPELFKEEKC